LIPTLAGYFGVTADELLGSDKIKSEEQILSYLKEYEHIQSHCTATSNDEKNVLAERAYREFPYDWRIINMYRQSLTCGYTDPFQPEKVRHICGMILDGCPVDKFRYNAINAMIYLAQQENNRDEEEKYIKRLPDSTYFLQCEQREESHWRAERMDDYLKQCQDNMMAYLSEMFGKADTLVNSGWGVVCNWYTPEERIAIAKKMIAVINILFEDGNYGVWTGNIGMMHMLIAMNYLRLGDIEIGLHNFELSVDYYLEHLRLPKSYQYVALCFNRVEYNEWPNKIPYTNEIEKYLHIIKNGKVYDCVRNDERFQRQVSRLINALLSA